jgi:hypothetical protein
VLIYCQKLAVKSTLAVASFYAYFNVRGIR